MEWKAKVRWLLALIFFRIRFMDTTLLRAVLQLLQPTNANIMNSTSVETVTWFRALNSELHDKIWRSHEQLTDAFLQHAKAGREYVEFYNRQIENHRLRPKLLPGNLAISLPLTMNDVRALWTPIEFAAHRGHWEPTSNVTKIPVEALRRASYHLISKVIGHWVRGGKLDYQLSISAKSALKDFQSSSDLNDPPDWPKFPPQTDRPCSVKSWEAFADHYPLAEDSPLFTALIQRIKTQDKPEVVVGTPKKSSGGKGDSLASDSEDTQESSVLSSLDSDDEIDSNLGDCAISHHGKTSQNSKEGSLTLDDFLLESCQRSDDPPTRERFRTPDAKSSAENIKYDNTSDPIDMEFTPKKQKPNHSNLPSGSGNPKSGIKALNFSVPEPKLNIVAGSTLSFRLDNDQPPELSGEYLSDDRIELVNIAHQNDGVRKVQIAKMFLGESSTTDDAYYGDSESGHIASLSSVGKAEYAMHCLARDILRYERVICEIAELKQRDEQMMKAMDERRQKAMARHKMMEDLERDSMSVNKANKAMGYAEHLREMNTYGMSSSGFGPIPSTPDPLKQMSPSSNQGSLWNNQSSPSYFTSSQTYSQPPGSLFSTNTFPQSTTVQPLNHSQNADGQAQVVSAEAAKRKAAEREERREKKRRKTEKRKEQERKDTTDEHGIDTEVVPDFPHQSSEQPLANPQDVVDRHDGPIQINENITQPDQLNSHPSNTLDPQSYAAAFRPRSRPTSAAGISENFFATATSAEGIVSQKKSPHRPNTGNQAGAPTENRDL